MMLRRALHRMIDRFRSSHEDLERKVAEKTRDLAALYAITSPISGTSELKSVLPDAIAMIMQVTGAEAAAIRLLDPESGRFVSASYRGFSEAFIRELPMVKRAEGVTAQIFKTGEPFILEDVLQDARGTRGALGVLAKEGFRSVAFLPLKTFETTHGIMTLTSREPGRLNPGQQELFTAIAHQISVTLENARLFEEIERRRREAEELGRVSRTLAETLDVSAVGQRIVESVLPLFAAQGAVVWLVQPDSSTVVLASTGPAEELLAPGYIFPAGVGLPARVIAEGRPVWSNDVLSHSDILLPDDVRCRLADSGTTAVLAVPLRAKGKTIGTLVIRDRAGRVFSKREVALLETFAAQGALALENAGLFEETERRRREAEELGEVARTLFEDAERRGREAEELARVARSLTESLDMTAVAERIVMSVRELFGVKAAMLRLLQPDGSLRALASRGESLSQRSGGDTLPQGAGLTGLAVAEGRPIWSADVLNEPGIPLSDEMREHQLRSGNHSMIAVPLRAHEKIIGSLGLQDRTGRVYSDGEVALLQTFADQAALALENARLYEETRRRSLELQALYTITNTTTQSLDIRALTHAALVTTIEVLGVDAGRLYVLDEGNHVLRLTAHHGLPVDELSDLQMYTPGEGIVGRIFSENRPAVFADLSSDSSYSAMSRSGKGKAWGFRSAAGLPITVKGRPVGVIYVYGRAVREFASHDLQLLSVIGGQIGAALENARLYQETERRGRETEELAQVARTLTESLDVKAVGERIVKGVQRLLDVTDATVYQLQDEQSLLALAVSDGSGLRKAGFILPVGAGVAGQAVVRGEPVFSTDVLHDPKIVLAELHERLAPLGDRSVLAVPLRSKGQIIGALSVSGRVGRLFTEAEVALLGTFGDQAALALENARLFKETERRLRETAALLDIAGVLGSTLELKLLLKEIALRTAQAVGMERCSIFLWHEGRVQPVMSQFADGHAVPELWRAFKGMERYRVEEIPGFAEAIRLRQPVVVEDAATIDRGPRGWAEIFSSQTILVVPLIRRDTVVGVIQVDNTTGPCSLRPDQIALAGTIASQVALAVDNTRLFEETQRRNLELQALYTVTNTTTQSLDIKSLAQAALLTTIQVLGVDAGRLYVFDETAHVLRLTAHHGLPVDELSDYQCYAPEEGVVGQIFSQNRPVVFADLSSDPTYAAMARSGKGKAWGFRSAAGLPITAKGRPAGVIYVNGRAVRQFTPQDLELLKVIGEQIGVALENAWLYDRAQRAKAEVERLYEMARETISTVNFDEVLSRMLRSAAALLDCHSSSIRLLNPETNMLRVVANYNLDEEFSQRGDIVLGEGRMGRVALEGIPSTIEDVAADPLYVHREEALRAGIRSIAIVPLRLHEATMGVLCLYDPRPRRFSEEEISSLTEVGNLLVLAIEKNRLFEETERRRGEAEELARVARSLTESLDVDEVATRIVDGVRRLLKVPESTVFQLQTDGSLVAVALSGVLKDDGRKAGYVLSPGAGVSGLAVARGEPVYCADILRDVEITKTDVHQHLEVSGIRAVICTPIRSKGQIIGALAAGDQAGRVYTEADIAVLQTFGDQAALALENARLYEAERTRQEQLSAVRKVGQEVSTELELEPLLHLIVRRAVELAGVSSGIVYTLEDEVLVPRAWWNLGPWLSEVRFRPGQGIPGIVAESGEAMIVNDYLNSPYVNPLFKEHSTVTALIAMPLISKGKVVGVITINNSTTNRRFTEVDQAILALFAPQAASAIENARLFEQTRRLVGELGATTKELRAKNKELDTFVYTVSHDLKAPLVTLQGMADLLAESCETDLDEQGRHYVQRIRANAQQMERLVQDLLALSRAGREGRAPEAVALDEVTEEILMEWGERIRARGATVTRHELPTLWGVRTQIEQVMSNLVGNAIKYLGDTPAPVVEIGAKDGGGSMVECYVKDNGIGIDPAYHEKVFEIFQRLKETEAEGTGVGLAIVKKIVEGAGGVIWVESAKGQGATFRFTWPRGEVAA